MEERCEAVRERLGAYLDGEIEDQEVRSIESHLDRCAACRAFLDADRIGDTLLRRGLIEEPIDPERERENLARLLDRIRREPSPAWERTERERKPGRPARWSWRVRWVAGLAAATAAVLLALRIGPFPMAPERPRPIPNALKVDAETGKAPETVAEEEASSREREAPPPEVAAQTAPPAPPAPRALPTPARSAGKEVADGASGGEADRETDDAEILPAEGEVQERLAPPPIPVEIRPGSEEKGKGEWTQDLTAGTPTSAVEKRADRGSARSAEPGSPEGIRLLHEMASAPSIPEGQVWQITPYDTLGPTHGWRARLEDAARRLETGRFGLDRSETARRWRMIGDLWEWIGRREEDREAFSRALDAYHTALLGDPIAADLDSIRVQRARRGSNPE